MRSPSSPPVSISHSARWARSARFISVSLARDAGVRRVLAGQGAGELFGGSPHYARQARYGRYEAIAPALRQTLIEPLLFHLAGGVKSGILERARDYIRQALAPAPQRLDAANPLSGYAHGEMFEDDFLAAVNPAAPLAALDQSWWRADGASEVNRLIALGLQFDLADRALPSLMKGCEMAGVEVGFPYLSDAMVALSARLTPRQKLDGCRLRPFFGATLRATLPGRLGADPIAPVLPFGLWLQTDTRLTNLAYDSLSDFKARRLVKADFIDRLLGQRVAEHPARHGQMVWLLMMLEQWLVHHRGAIDSLSQVGQRHEPETCR